MWIDNRKLQIIAGNAGRYNIEATSGGWATSPTMSKEMASYDWQYEANTSGDIKRRLAGLKAGSIAREEKDLIRKKQDALNTVAINKHKTEQAYIKQMEGAEWLSSDQLAQVESNYSTRNEIFKQVEDKINAANTLKDFNNVVAENKEILAGMPTFQPTAAPVAPRAPAPSGAPIAGRKTSRVLSTVRGGKHFTAGVWNVPVKPEVQKTPEQIAKENLIQEHINAGRTPEEAKALAESRPNEHPTQQGFYWQIKTDEEMKGYQPPVQITDKTTLDAIDAAKTPEEKQAIVDKWNMEKTQEAADKNIQFKKEADTNSDGVIDAKEAGKFQEAHAAATYNLAAQEQNKINPNNPIHSLDPGRRKVLEDLAKGNGIDTGASGQKYQTAISGQDKAYMDNFKSQWEEDSTIKDVNAYISSWNAAKTKEERVKIKGDLNNYVKWLKNSPDLFARVSEHIQKQLGSVEEPQKAANKQQSFTVEDIKNLPTEYKKLIPWITKAEGRSDEWKRAEIAKIYNNWKSKPEATATGTTPIGAWAVNAWGATRVDHIEKGNNPDNLWQGQLQIKGVEENQFTQK